MRKVACLLVLAAMTSPAWADCSYPKAPGKMPDGRTASRDEMVTAQRTVKAFQTEMSTYLTCIKAEHDEALAKEAATMTDEQKQAITKRFTQKNDAAVDAETEVAERFNEQLRAYNKAKEGK